MYCPTGSKRKEPVRWYEGNSSDDSAQGTHGSHRYRLYLGHLSHQLGEGGFPSTSLNWDHHYRDTRSIADEQGRLNGESHRVRSAHNYHQGVLDIANRHLHKHAPVSVSIRGYII